MGELASPVLILGARSDIGRALAKRYAERGCSIILAARNASRLGAEQADLQTRYRVPVRVVEFDVNDKAPDRFFAALEEAPGTLIMVVGLLGDQKLAESDDAEAALTMQTNYSGPARFLLAGVRCMRQRSDACIIAISSVAGERGRGSNFVYGSAKAGLTAFMSGLRNRLARERIHVITVKPGFVATRMTAHLELPPLLTATPDDVAAAVVNAHLKKRDVVYVAAKWRLIMAVIRLIPERVFKRLSL